MWIRSTDSSCSREKSVQQIYLLLLRLNAHADQRFWTEARRHLCTKTPKITIYWHISGHDTSSDFIVRAAENTLVFNNSVWKKR